MALDEPNEKYVKFTSNDIEVLVHPDLAGQLKSFGGVSIDYIDHGPHQRGFTITTGKPAPGSDCSGCGSSGGCDEEHD